MKPVRLVVLGVVLVAFTAFSIHVTIAKGYFGFLTNAREELWGLQVLLDLVIALTLLTRHMVGKGRELGIPVWPYILSLPFLGSIGALVFYIHAELAARGRSGPPAAEPPSPDAADASPA